MEEILRKKILAVIFFAGVAKLGLWTVLRSASRRAYSALASQIPCYPHSLSSRPNVARVRKNSKTYFVNFFLALNLFVVLVYAHEQKNLSS